MVRFNVDEILRSAAFVFIGARTITRNRSRTARRSRPENVYPPPTPLTGNQGERFAIFGKHFAQSCRAVRAADDY